MVKVLRKKNQFPIIIEKDEDGYYTVECPIFDGCYSQGDSIDEALKNIEEVIAMCLEEKGGKEIVANYNPQNITFSTVSI